MIYFGLSFLGVVHLNFLKGGGESRKSGGILSSFLFGLIYSVNLTPCIGAFLGSALMLVVNGGEVGKGVLLMALYSLGLGIPFLLAGILTVKLNQAFIFIKKHYEIFNRFCGIFLIGVGILTACGGLNWLMGLFA